jgi:hypothetical protein
MSTKVDGDAFGASEVDPDESKWSPPADEWVSLVDLLENKRVSPAQLTTAIEQKGICVIDGVGRRISATECKRPKPVSKRLAMKLLADYHAGLRCHPDLDPNDRLYTFGWPKNAVPDFREIASHPIEDAMQSRNPEPEAERNTGQTNSKPLSRQRHQEQEILQALRQISYDPAALPPNKAGKPGAKAAARDRLNQSSGIFNKAWDRLLASKEIQYAP